MRLENISIKIGIATAVVVLIAVIGFALAVGRWQEGVEQRLTNLEETVEPLEKKVDSRDIDITQIETDLAWIKAALIRIEERQSNVPATPNQ